MFEKHKYVFGMCVFDLKKNWHLIQNKFFYLMRAECLMRGRELNTDMSHQVVPTMFEGIYVTATGNVVCCLKRGHGWFQKV